MQDMESCLRGLMMCVLLALWCWCVDSWACAATLLKMASGVTSTTDKVPYPWAYPWWKVLSPSTLTLSIVPCCVLGATQRYDNIVVRCFKYPWHRCTWVSNHNKKEALSLNTSHVIPRAWWASHNYTKACVGDTANQFLGPEWVERALSHTPIPASHLHPPESLWNRGWECTARRNASQVHGPQVCPVPGAGATRRKRKNAQRIALTSPYFWISICISFLQIT